MQSSSSTMSSGKHRSVSSSSYPMDSSPPTPPPPPFNKVANNIWERPVSSCDIKTENRLKLFQSKLCHFLQSPEIFVTISSSRVGDDNISQTKITKSKSDRVVPKIFSRLFKKRSSNKLAGDILLMPTSMFYRQTFNFAKILSCIYLQMFCDRLPEMSDAGQCPGYCCHSLGDHVSAVLELF